MGFKLHLIINNKGEIMAIKITKGNASDLSAISALTKGLEGKLFGDIPNINHFAHSVTRKLSVIRLTNISNIRGIELSKNSNIAFLKS